MRIAASSAAAATSTLRTASMNWSSRKSPPPASRLGVANFFIHHFGHLESAPKRTDKGIYYRDLLRLKVEEEPNDPAGWVQLGSSGIRALSRSGRGSTLPRAGLAAGTARRRSLAVSGHDLRRRGKVRGSPQALDHDTRKGPSAALSEQVRGDALYSLNHVEEARAALSAGDQCRRLRSAPGKQARIH